jgi:hypothetical protein
MKALHKLSLSLWLGIGLLWWGGSAHAARAVYFSADATVDGDGSSTNSPRLFNAITQFWLVYTNLTTEQPDHDATIYFMAATNAYSVVRMIEPSGTNSKAAYRIRLMGLGTRPEQVVLRNDLNLFPGGSPQTEETMVTFPGITRAEVHRPWTATGTPRS